MWRDKQPTRLSAPWATWAASFLMTLVVACGGGGGAAGPASPAGTPPPAITAFAVGPTAINLGQSTQLTWVVSGATGLSLDHGVGAVGGTTTAVSPATTTTYKSWFTSDLTVNITDPYSLAKANVGRSAAQFH